ncbi:MAG: alpha-ketoacid dehydrogenase subunit beta [Eubacteriaceae bacterium]|jgi:pyruvate dehydrogenase E1 component beta subunit|nr:alpha-ketoacid dehydrogenase subunit beta [Eubacteriaceae bacterium]
MKIPYSQAIRDAMREAMMEDESVVLVGEDIGLYGGCFGVSRGMIEEFGPERIIETPISETAFSGAAVGMALMGMRPIVEIMFGDFVTLAADPIINHAAKYRFMSGGQVSVPLVLRTPFGSGTGAAAQHSQTMEAMFLNTPGLKVVAPATPKDAKGLLRSAIADPGPVLFFENKLLYRQTGEVPESPYSIPIGKAEIKRPGSDITLITWSRMLDPCLQAADALEQDGVSAEVLDLRTLRPLDSESIAESVKRTSRALIVYEAPKFGGFGGEATAAIMESEAFYYLDHPVKRLAGKEIPVPYSPELESSIAPSAGSIRQMALEMTR